MIPDKVTSHPDEAVELLTEKWRGKPVVEGLLRALVTPFDGLEASAWDVLEGRVLGAEGCAGVWLDALGSLVKEPRNGRNDEVYEAAIRVRIRVNRSQGRAFDVIEVARLLDAVATYYEYFPLAWEVEIYDTPYGGDFVRLLAETKATTSYGVLLTSSWEVEDVSMFEDSSNGSPTDLFESAI